MKVCFFSLGCDKNKTDSEKIIFYLQKKYDIELTYEPSKADVAIVNTCSFIKDAKEESISIINYLEKLKKDTSLKKILILGCLTKDSSVDLSKILKNEDVVLSLDKYMDDLFNIGDRMRNILSFSSSIKISDGCNKKCSYCIIPNLRGNYRSNSIENIYDETIGLVKNGTKELNIIAQDTLNYGIDLYGKRAIVELINKLSTIKELSWIRLLYCYPEEIDYDLIKLYKTNKKLLHYIDMPLQHVNDKILKMMNRSTTKQKIIETVEKLREAVPDIIIRTTFIVGFPSETNEQYNELIDFIKCIKFDKVGAFAYSREKNTASYNYTCQIDETTKEKRLKNLLKVQSDIVREKKKNYIGNIYNCIVEGYDTNKKMYIVRSYMDARDIDEVIFVKTNLKLISGNFVNVKIKGIFDIDMIGEIV